MGLFYPYAIDIDGTLVDGIGDQSIDPGAQVARPDHDGAIDGKLCFVAGYDPIINFSTYAVETGIAALGGVLLPAKAIGSADTCTLYCQEGAAGGGRETTGATKILVNMGIVICNTISAGNRTPATMAMQIIPVHDGTNNPLTITADQSLAGTPAADEMFFAGPASLNNVAMGSVKSVSINTGITLDKTDHAGSAHYSFVCVKSVRPMITITTDNVELAATYQGGVAVSAATFVYLRKGTPGGGRVADGTSQPKFTVNAGMIISRAISGSPQQMAIDIIPYKDSSNLQIVYSSAAIA